MAVRLRLLAIGFAVAIFVTAVSSPADAVELDIQLAVNPQTPTSAAHTFLDFSIPNYGVEVGATFTPAVTITGNALSVALAYVSPVIFPGNVGLPTYFSASGQVDLGVLTPGDYTLTAVVPGYDSVTIDSATIAFAVVPEPATTGLIGVASAFVLMRRVRRAGQRSR